ncbi:hypothetical protein EIN_154510 [Entamoeba invadens IP1]|uniref:Transmembrane protein n=1 Tax=Entamoeba invadens IP1 TaxID=370355 RepID=A0A0A1U926_ENTIV|nr:hypothetical protein EIN_154510 [Entamoeba invadens IP1]ELP91384.1 hypothetical protein EIN_154510 [Entamoeba invadens IP1]|eukprot:XP_004258155.1 hypothetical protein EIN_154510 [Entamoeba invadens IP1]
MADKVVDKKPEIDLDTEFYPCCITWTTIPVISWFLPFIGHPAVCDTKGIHHDYSFPHIVHAGRRTILGRTFKYLPLQFGDGVTCDDFEKAIDTANKKWKHIMHKYIIDNCHDYCVDILNDIKYKNKDNWCNFTFMLELLFHSVYVNKSRHFATYLPGIILWSFILLAIGGFIVVMLYQKNFF